MAQYSLGTNASPFTAPGQTITLSYILGNASASDATVTATLSGQIGSPSCPDPVQVNANSSKTCTFTYQTSLTDVTANQIAVNSQWNYCATAGCSVTNTLSDVLTIKYQGAPVISGASMAVPYNSPGTSIDLSSHVIGTTLYLSVASPPAHGSAAVSGETIIYTPAVGYYGPDTYSYTATGPSGTSAPASITVTVALPPPPTAAAAAASIPYNSAGTAIDLTSKISGVATGITIAGGPGHGTVATSGTSVTYTPTTGYIGADSVTYTANGPGGSSAPATIALTVVPPPPPTTAAATVTVPYGSTGTPIDLTAKITGIVTSIAVTGGPSHGTVSIAGTVVTYAPAAGYTGTDSFTYSATGPGGTSTPATVSLTVPTPSAPLAAAASGTVPYNSPGTPLDLTAKITGVVTSVAVATGPGHGTVSIRGTVATYVPAAGYSGADSFTYIATGPGGASAPATVSLTVSAPIVTGGTLTVTVAATGADGTFTFVSTVPGASTFALLTSGGIATKVISSVPAGAFSVVQTGQPAGMRVQSIQCNGASSGGTTAAGTMTNGGAVTCTFADRADLQGIQTATSATIRNFMRSRANSLVSSEPDTARRHARVLGSLAGDDADAPQAQPAPRPSVSGPGAGAGPVIGSGRPGAGRFAQNALGQQQAPQSSSQQAPMSFSGNIQDGSGQMAFATSLSQIRQTARDNEMARLGALGGPQAIAPAAGSVRPALFDIWIEGHTTMYADNSGGGNRRGNVNLVYLGADYLVHKAVLIGALVQFDQAREKSSVLGTSAAGTGWMAGPYVTARLTKNVLFDARAAWGQSSNQVSPFGTYQDTLATSRALMSAKLSGHWHSGGLRISPTLDVTYFQEQQKAFTSVTGAAIPDQTIALGRLSVGPEFGTKIKTSDGGVFEPFTSLKALWDFKRDATVSIGGMDVGTNAIRGKVEAGASYTTSSGVAIKGAASFDGIGDRDFHAIEGKVSVRVPLQ